MPVLSDARIRTLKPKEKPYKKANFDGLYLLVKPNASKLWRFKYRWLQKEKLLALGRYPEVTLADARRKRQRPQPDRKWRRSFQRSQRQKSQRRGREQRYLLQVGSRTDGKEAQRRPCRSNADKDCLASPATFRRHRENADRENSSTGYSGSAAEDGKKAITKAPYGYGLLPVLSFTMSSP